MKAYFKQAWRRLSESSTVKELAAAAEARRADADRMSPGKARQSVLLEASRLEARASIQKLMDAAELQRPR
jgi:hypothetical protein